MWLHSKGQGPTTHVHVYLCQYKELCLFLVKLEFYRRAELLVVLDIRYVLIETS